MSDLGRVFIAIGVILLIIIASIYVSGFISMGTADFRGEVDKKEKVEANGNYRIDAYNEFYDTCSSIQAKQDQINNLNSLLATESDTSRKNDLKGAILANENQKASLIREYNAKASAKYTVGQFKDSNLPYHIDSNDKDVECGS